MNIEKQIKKILLEIEGADKLRPGVKETPARVAKAFAHWFGGYSIDTEELLSKTFSETDGYDQIVMLRGIRFVSHCEHHLAPIIGTATVAYIPRDRVVGISKLARVVDAFARRLQIQERMTEQIKDSVVRALDPLGVFVHVEGVHQCMTTRGVQQHGTSMVTTAVGGVFMESDKARAEVMAMMRGNS